MSEARAVPVSVPVVTERRCIVTVHAHPDDESSKGPGTIARYRAEGVRTVLVCCTDGAEGDVHNPALDAEAVKADLKNVRRQELEAATAIIGYDRVVHLDYRDSGMADSEANAHPESFHQAPLEEATEKLVAILREERPQVLITYPDVQDQYPHPDHLKVHDISMAAFLASGDPGAFPSAGPAHQVDRLFYVTWPAERVRKMHEMFVELGLESPYDAEFLARIDAHVDDATHKVDITGFGHIRELALKAHATQVDPTSKWWFGLPSDVQAEIYPFEHYRLALPVPEGEPQDASDLFEGLA